MIFDFEILILYGQIDKIQNAEGLLEPNKATLNSSWTEVPWIEVEASQQHLLSLLEHTDKSKTRRICKSHQPVNNFPVRQLGAQLLIVE